MSTRIPRPDLEGETLCARCARLGTTCCQNTQVFLTIGDMARLTSSGETDFHEVCAPPDPARVAGLELDPLWHRTFADAGRRRVLRHRPGGDCVFLTPSGCRLHLAIRPLICRLYPFDYNETTIKGVDAPLCPEPECDAPPLLLALLGMHRDQAVLWRRQLYAEIEAEVGESNCE